MERDTVIRDLNEQIETLARLHIRHGLYHSEGFRRRREHIRKLIAAYDVDVRKELDPMVSLLYRRYFD